ncbi:MAG: protein translocase subunit SecD [Firmicutes bacterium]|nr:protein translocase subunit SecD [Bacillota bacterium]
MKRRGSIVRLGVMVVVVALGLILSFVPMNFGNTTFRGFAHSIMLGLDLQGGVYAVYQMDAALDGDTTDLSQRMDATRTRLETLLVSRGFTESNVVRQGADRIRVEVPGIGEPGALLDVMGEPAELSFRMDDPNGAPIAGLTGRNVTSVGSGFDPQQGGYVVHLTFDSIGTAAFSQATAPENHGRSISIVATVGGVDQEVSRPTIQAHIPNGRAVITGMPSAAAAQRLSDQILAGQFEVRLTLLESDTIPATLGEAALFYAVLAGIIGVLLLLIYMVLVYKMFGGLASLALLSKISLLLFFLAVVPWVQLTLPGLAGVILSIGMATDAEIIIFERIKDEYRGGKSLLASFNAGYKRAFWPVFDANVTSIIAAVILWIFGTGPVVGFAVTLLIGILLSFFTSMVVTRFLCKWMLKATLADKPKHAARNEKLYGLKRGKNYQAPTDESQDGQKVVEIEKKDMKLTPATE